MNSSAQVESAVRQHVLQALAQDPTTAGAQIESLQLKPLTDRHFIAIVRAAKVGGEVQFQMGFTYDGNGLQVNWVKENNTMKVLETAWKFLCFIVACIFLVWDVDRLVSGAGDAGKDVLGILMCVIVIVWWFVGFYKKNSN